MHRTQWLLSSLVFICLSISGNPARGVDAHSLAQTEQAAHKAYARFTVLLLKGGKTDFSSCKECQAAFTRMQLAWCEEQKRYPKELSSSLSEKNMGKQSQRRYDLARRSTGIWEKLLAEYDDFADSASLCGQCEIPDSDSRIAALEKNFSDRSRGVLMMEAIVGSLTHLNRASEAFWRRSYDLSYRTRFNKLFTKWFVEANEERIAVIAGRIEAVYHQLLVRSMDPAPSFMNPVKHPNREIREFYALDLNAFGFVHPLEDAPLGWGIFILPRVFGNKLDMIYTVIHEESHITADTRDYGMRLSPKTGRALSGPNIGPNRALDDAYSFSHFIMDLYNLQ